MNREQYRAARKLFKGNGAYSFRWMNPQAASVIKACFVKARPIDCDALAMRECLRKAWKPIDFQASIKWDHANKNA